MNASDLQPDLVLRPIGPGDVPAVLRYFEELSPASRAKFHPHPFDEEHARWIVATADGRDNVRLVAVAQGAILGYGYFSGRGDRECPSVGLGVIDRAQGQGLGRRLMAALIDEARRLGKPGLELCVYKDNGRALAVYTQVGFRVTGESADGLQHTMRLELADREVV